MSIRRTLVPLVLVAATVLAGCGGEDDGSATGSSSSGAEASQDGGGAVAATPVACDLLTTEQVTAAVGAPVKEGAATGGPAVTGGRFSTCVWQSDDPASPADTATVTIYPNAAAADSARGSDDMDVEGIGDQAFSGSFASIWAYVGDQSLFAQWYTLSGSDDENRPHSEALARSAADAL